MRAKHDTPSLDLAEIFKKYEKRHGPVKEEPDNGKTDWGKIRGKEVW